MKGKGLATVAWVFVAMAAAVALGQAQESGPVKSVQTMLYQPGRVLSDRVASTRVLGEYIRQMLEVVRETYPAVSAVEELDVVVVLLPEKRAKIWYVSSLESPPDRSSLTEKLQVLDVPEVQKGPVAFALSVVLDPKVSDGPQAPPAEKPLPWPKEWEAVVKQIGGESVAVERVLEQIWKGE